MLHTVFLLKDIYVKQTHTTTLSILKSDLAPTVKNTTIDSLQKLTICHCINGRPMKGLKEYGATRVSTTQP